MSGNIIQIRHNDIRQADMAFAEFMQRTEDYLNNLTKANHRLYKNCDGEKMEKVALNALRNVAPSTPFRREEIRLVSGAMFPDIVAEKHYGVEVKTTKTNSWKSTGSSIIESTRVEDISRIFMLFGKLGGEYAQFKCRPYEDCMSNIAVTHSPRYLIDMELSPEMNLTIFDKMGTQYSSFRLMDEKEKVAKVRAYYKNQAAKSGKVVMPWWMDSDHVSQPTLSLFSDLPVYEKNNIISRLFILFAEDILKGDYKRAALWICSRYSVIVINMRDLFSAGGKINSLDNVRFSSPVPQVIGRLYKFREQIVHLLNNPDAQMVQDVADCWSCEPSPKEYLNLWLDCVERFVEQKDDMKSVKVRDLFGDVI